MKLFYYRIFLEFHVFDRLRNEEMIVQFLYEYFLQSSYCFFFFLKMSLDSVFRRRDEFFRVWRFDGFQLRIFVFALILQCAVSWDNHEIDMTANLSKSHTIECSKGNVFDKIKWHRLSIFVDKWIVERDNIMNFCASDEISFSNIHEAKSWNFKKKNNII